MALSVSGIKEIQKRLQEKDYETAYTLCQEILQSLPSPSSSTTTATTTSPPNGLLNVYVMHGTCAYQLEQYLIAEKSFRQAIELDVTGQFIQKLWKNLADIYEKLENWKNYCEASLQLYNMTKEKGNYDRSIVLATSIQQSYEKTNQYEQALQFLVTHILELGHVNTMHTLHMLSVLQLMKLKSNEKKSTIIPATRNRQEESKDLFDNSQLYEIALQTLSNCLQLELGSEDEIHLANVLKCVFDHLLFEREKIFDKSNSKFLMSSDYLNLIRLTLTTISSLFHPKPSEQCSPSRYSAHLIALNILACLIEMWFIDKSLSYDTIHTDLEQGILVCNWLKTFPEAPTNVPEDSDPSRAIQSLSQISTFFYSAQILENLNHKKLRKCLKLSELCASHWREIINSHSTMSSSRTSTLNAPASLPPAISSIQMKLQVNLCNTIMMMICTCIGCLVNFCGDAVNNMTITELLYLTQYSYRAVNSMKLSFSLAERTSFCLDPLFVQLIPLAKIKSLIYVGQTESALRTAADIGFFIYKKEESNPYQLLSKKRRIPTSKPQINYELHVDYVQNYLNHSSHLCQWQLITILTSLEYHSDVENILDKFLTSTDSNGSIPLLTCERIWNRFLRDLAGSSSSSVVDAEDVLKQYHCKRDRTLPHEIVASLELAIQALLLSNEPDALEIEVLLRYRLGVIQWCGGSYWRNDKSKCVAGLLAAAKLDPNYGCLYTYLGHYYSTVMNDYSRAIKCYIKALTYDPMEAEAGVCLSLLRLSNDDLVGAKKLWNDVITLTASHSRWCYGMSGKVHFCLEEYDDAITAFQKSLELDESDILDWYRLGLCYLSLTQYTASMKSLQFALDLLSIEYSGANLSKSQLYVTVLATLAEVKRKLCCLHESLQLFKEALTLTDNHNLFVLKGYGDVCLALAYERFTIGWTSGCGEIIRQGLHVTDLAKKIYLASQQPIPLCLHKLRGDLYTFCRYLGPNDVSTDDEIWSQQTLFTFLHQGEVEYRIHLEQCQYRYNTQQQHQEKVKQDELLIDNEFLVASYYDLGCAIYYRAIAYLSALGQGTGLLPTRDILENHYMNHSETPNSLFKEALKIFLEGLKVSETPHSGCWNGVGLCIQQDDSLREACLILATKIEPNVPAYANLSLLLIHHDLHNSAKECLSEVQLIDSNPLHWLNLGALLEKEPITSDSDTKGWAIRVYDAYTASIEVAKPTDAFLGIALAWLRAKGLLSIKPHLYAPICTDRVSSNDVKHFVENRLHQFLHRRPIHPLAWALLGWSLQYRRNWVKALEAYKHALHSMNLIVKSCNTPPSHEASSQFSLLVKFILHHLCTCHVLTTLVTGSTSSFSALVDAIDVGDIKRYIPDVLFSQAHFDLTAQTLQHSLQPGPMQSQIEQSFSTSRTDVGLILLCFYLSRNALCHQESYSAILIKFGEWALKAQQSSESSVDIERNALAALQYSAECAIAIMETIMNSGRFSEFGPLSWHLKDIHPSHPRILLIARALETRRSEESLSLATRALTLSSKYLLQTVMIEEFDSTKQPFRCDLGSCACDESLVIQGSSLVSCYSESVSAHLMDRIQTGLRSTKENRKDILRAIFLDPANMSAWSTLVGVIYCDQVMGPATRSSETQTESKDTSPGEASMVTITGLFADQDSLGLCSKIASFLTNHSPQLLNPVLSLLLSHLTSTSDSPPVAMEGIPATILNKMFQARKEYQSQHYPESMLLYREAIDLLSPLASSSPQYSDHLHQLTYELAQIYSHHLHQPEEAETLYQQCLHLQRSPDSSRYKYHISSALAYLRRYQQSKLPADIEKARNILETSLEGIGSTMMDNSSPSLSLIQLQAVCHILHGYMWEVQGKHKKAVVDYELGTATYPHLDLPFLLTK